MLKETSIDNSQLITEYVNKYTMEELTSALIRKKDWVKDKQLNFFTAEEIEILMDHLAKKVKKPVVFNVKKFLNPGQQNIVSGRG